MASSGMVEAACRELLAPQTSVRNPARARESCGREDGVTRGMQRKWVGKGGLGGLIFGGMLGEDDEKFCFRFLSSPSLFPHPPLLFALP